MSSGWRIPVLLCYRQAINEETLHGRAEATVYSLSYGEYSPHLNYRRLAWNSLGANELIPTNILLSNTLTGILLFGHLQAV